MMRNMSMIVIQVSSASCLLAEKRSACAHSLPIYVTFFFDPCPPILIALVKMLKWNQRSMHSEINNLKAVFLTI